MSKHAIILGSGSDIGSGIAERLRADGWGTHEYRHSDPITYGNEMWDCPWDLLVCCYGTLEPIDKFWDTADAEWEAAFQANLFLPLRQVKVLYPWHNSSGASVCFFSGAGANGPAPTYSAYCVSKIALTKMVECLDAESDDCRFFILGPGMMRTKIQEQTLAAGERAANYERVSKFMESGDEGASPDRLYEFLMACVAAPKAAVGGRNLYVPGDDPARLGELAADPDAFKLRRASDSGLRRTE